ncbi:serine/threonine-protein phosphatase 6 regulatory ankyrin repeat subunit B-like [Haliotis rufescens]|uniref:serine/threonine-protein phosphatase 6 regulatory ankyrin repeat subunit B-like n=1 Tax=Haliotis rufescens TaxID=6454 RepID=UPI00201ED74F|nr:serine/threonine-protein phosphatase 6 regulatory ankyrin repeat subunit B-like [Haliotis rufescens]
MINSKDASKHVSTCAEDAAYKRLLEQGFVVIKGRSGSGKSHMGYTLLQRALKQFQRKPVKISSPDEWNYLPKSSNPKSDVAIHKYIVMIDDIFGSTNLIQHNLDQWRQKFDLVWPQVESGQICVCHSKKFHQLLESLIDKLAPVQIKDRTVKTLLHKAAWSQCKICIKMLISDVEGTDSDGNTALHCMIKSDENHDHEVLELLMEKTNHRHIKNNSGALPLHIAARRQCKECISHLLREADVSKDHTGNPVHCTFDEGASHHRDESRENVFHVWKGSDVIMSQTKTPCKERGELLLPKSDINDQDEAGNTALHYLIHNESYYGRNECLDHETYQLFLDNGADVHIKNKGGKTALHLAAKANCKNCVKMLLLMSDINDQDEVGNTVLHYLNHYQSYDLTKVERVCQETCQIFLDSGADVHIKNKEGKTALRLAAEANCKNCVKMLLPMSDINDQDEVGNTALHYLNHYQSYDLTKVERVCQETCKIFLDNGAEVRIKNKVGKTALHLAAKANCKNCVEMLLPKSDINDQDEAGNTALHYLIHNESYHYGRKECLDHETYQLFLDNGADVHIKNKEGKTALHLAAKANCRNCVKMLLPKSDINAQDEHGNTALHYLHHYQSYYLTKVERVCQETCQIFLDKRADVHIKNKEGKTALHLAAEANCKNCVKMLVPKSDMNAQDEHGNTALHYLHHYQSYYLTKVERVCQETCQIFLDKRADVHIKNKEGKTALHLAAEANCKNCVEMLLPMSEINEQDWAGNTALHYLIHNKSYHYGRKECLDHATYQLFLDNRADVTIKNKKGKTALRLAAKANCKRCVKMLLPMSDVNEQDWAGNTALHFLIHNKSYHGMSECLDHETYQLFLDNRTDVTIKDKEGKTALHLAARANCKRCVKMLLPKSDINGQDEDGNTALHYLINNESYHYGRNECLDHETYQLFLDNGADVHIKNKEGKTYLHLAAKANCKNCVEMLLP